MREAKNGLITIEQMIANPLQNPLEVDFCIVSLPIFSVLFNAELINKVLMYRDEPKIFAVCAVLQMTRLIV